jgi:hypothetical protein
MSGGQEIKLPVCSSNYEFYVLIYAQDRDKWRALVNSGSTKCLELLSGFTIGGP